MSFDPLHSVSRESRAAAGAIPELSLVALRRPREVEDGRIVPAGSVGTVVATWAMGKAYEVEFSKPFHALATIEHEDLELTERFEG